MRPQFYRERANLAMAAWAAVLLVAIVILYGWNGNGEEVETWGPSALRWMVRRWNLPGGEMSHGWLVPVVSTVALWRKRKALAHAGREPWFWGLGAVGAALLLLPIAVRVQQTRLSLLSLVMLLWSIPTYAFGLEVGRHLLFPCSYLLLAIPLTFLDALSFPLRRLAACVSAWLLSGLGISTHRVGTMLHVGVSPPLALDVADACSGLRYLLAMIAVTAAYAHFTQRGWLRQWLVFLGAVPAAVAGNIVRVMLIGLVAIGFGPGPAHRVYHYASGFIIFTVAVLLMTGWGSLLARAEKGHGPKASPPAPKPAAAGVSKGAAGRLATVAVLCAATWGTLRILRSESPLRPALPPLTLPDRLGAWEGYDLWFCQKTTCARAYAGWEIESPDRCPACGAPLGARSVAEQGLLPADTQIRRRLYRNPQYETLAVALVTSATEQRGLHRPERCLPAQGVRVDRRRHMSVPLPPAAPLEVTVLEGRSGETGTSVPLLHVYWFTDGHTETASNWARLWRWSRDRLRGQTAQVWTYVGVTTYWVPAHRQEAAVRELLGALVPRLRGSARSEGEENSHGADLSTPSL